jgi:outer membrane protein assembly factor BamA
MYKFTIILFLLTTHLSSAQDNKVTISDIVIEGNYHSRKRTILQELNIKKNDTLLLKDIQLHLDNNRLRVLSTGLFNSVIINLSEYDINNSTAKLLITVEENWYIFPMPIFELADRNFSVWWQEQNKSLSRVNYGLRLSHYNFSGNRDPLRLKVHFGYTTKYELTYKYPFFALDNKLGIGGSIFYSENREIAYKTENNKSLFARNADDRKLLSRFRIGPEIKYRPDTYNFHALRLEYHRNKVDEYVIEVLNPDYFLNGRQSLNFFYLEYDYSMDKREYAQYPLGGYMLFGNIKKEGLGIFNQFNNLSITLGVENHWSLCNKRLILSTRNKFKTNIIRSTLSFANNTGLGWDTDIVSGYDLYVMDGTDYGITMNALKYMLLDNNLNTVKWMPRQFRKMNMSVFLRFNLDAAYVNERTYVDTNTLNNRIIFGYGPALDLILFNNFLFSFEYSFNDIGDQGLYLISSISF